MSLFVDEIVHEIKTKPLNWIRHTEHGLKHYTQPIEITGCGNGEPWLFYYITSIVEVEISGLKTWHNLSIRDKRNLECAFRWWMRNASIVHLVNK